MKPVDIILILLIIGVLMLALYLNARRKRTSTCCGDCSKCVKAAPVGDRVKAHYPYEATAEITGMTCQNCAVTVENALNELEGVWAAVRIDTKTARILSKNPVDEAEVRARVHSAGYGIRSFQVVHGK